MKGSHKPGNCSSKFRPKFGVRSKNFLVFEEMASHKSLNISMSRIVYLHNSSRDMNVAMNKKELVTNRNRSLNDIRKEKKACAEKNFRQIQKDKKEEKSCVQNSVNVENGLCKKKIKIIDEKYDKCVEDYIRILKEDLEEVEWELKREINRKSYRYEEKTVAKRIQKGKYLQNIEEINKEKNYIEK